LFGLTKGEAQVALGIASGKAADEIAHERAVSVGTVRTQLKALLQKTETDRQAELVRLLLTIPTVATQPQGPGSV
jgi:DNA-binding CsgD family transcriptional regulator